ncbi:Solute carrier family 35 member F6 [Halotydeus destructor]|nr:Solute carrier family 35 member F6 [Halotydeus destructor]
MAAWTPYQIFLAIMMVITGSINTLATKWADESKSVGRDGRLREFNHPFLQAVGMFFGEFTCLIAFKILYMIYRRRQYTESDMPAMVSGTRDYSPFIFFLPALCDMVATSTMYIGLNLTYASSFQMLRGALIIFTGLLSVAFLGRVLKVYEWIGIFFVILGLSVVGTSDLFSGKDSGKGINSLITGDLLIVTAQIITAAQMVIEEKFVSKRNISPLEAVGWEGFFGFTTLSVLLIPMYYIKVGQTIFQNPEDRLEDAIDGVHQIMNSWQVATGFLGTIVSIAFFNFAGISVTKEMSATTRTVLDSVRTFVIWIFSLSVGWQGFSGIQLLGFIVLLAGMFLYNDVIIRPTIRNMFRPGTSINVEADQDPIIPNLSSDSEDALAPVLAPNVSGSINADEA